jgi:hypothetical protein
MIIIVDNFMIEELLNTDQASVDNSKVVAKMLTPAWQLRLQAVGRSD